MAKGKKHKGKKGGGSEEALKIPKTLRKAGKKAMKLAKEPVVTEIVAAALLSAAAALRGGKAGGKAGAKAGARGIEGGAQAAAGAGREAVKLGDSLRALALDLAHRTLESWEAPPRRKSDWGSGGEGAKARPGAGPGKG